MLGPLAVHLDNSRTSAMRTDELIWTPGAELPAPSVIAV